MVSLSRAFLECPASLFFLLLFSLKEKLKDSMLKDTFSALIMLHFFHRTQVTFPLNCFHFRWSASQNEAKKNCISLFLFPFFPRKNMGWSKCKSLGIYSSVWVGRRWGQALFRDAQHQDKGQNAVKTRASYSATVIFQKEILNTSWVVVTENNNFPEKQLLRESSDRFSSLLSSSLLFDPGKITVNVVIGVFLPR